MFHKVWNAFNKSTNHQLTEKGLSMHYKPFGAFKIDYDQLDKLNKSVNILFFPSAELCSAMSINNVSSKTQGTSQLDWVAIGNVCDMNAQSAQWAFDQILRRIIYVIKQGSSVKIEFKFGVVNMRPGSYEL